jgi:hypothetical protein
MSQLSDVLGDDWVPAVIWSRTGLVTTCGNGDIADTGTASAEHAASASVTYGVQLPTRPSVAPPDGARQQVSIADQGRAQRREMLPSLARRGDSPQNRLRERKPGNWLLKRQGLR